MMNNGIKSMTNYANNYPPHINAIQQMVTQVITIPYQHTTCHCFSQFFFHKHFVLPLISFHTMPLTYISTLCFYSFFSLAFGHILFFLSLGSRPLLLFFLLCSMLFQIIQQYKNNGNASICYWMHVSKLVKVEEKKVMAQRGETTDIFVG